MRSIPGLIVLGTLFLGCVSSSVIAATFEVPRNFEILYVDLKKADVFGNDFKVNITQGHHQFVIRFHQRVRGGDDVNVFQSEPIVIDMEVAEQDKLMLEAPYYYHKGQVERYAKAPGFSIVDKTHQQNVIYQERILPKRSGLQNLRDYTNEIRQFNLALENGGLESMSAPEKNKQTKVLERLKFWYNKADDVARKDIRIWMIDTTYQPKAESTPYDMLTLWFNKASQKERRDFQVWLLY